MSATNKTAVYELPIFLGSDVPSWLTDWNGAMGDIDTAIAAAKAAADAAASTASTAATDIVTINGQITSLQNTVGTHTTQIGTISGNINTINSLIGNGTPTTTDQTIIGAINELHANQGDLANLTTTDKSSLVAAINEAAQGGGGGTETVRYYNGYIQYSTDNGVTWTNLINVSTPAQILPVMTNNTSSYGTASVVASGTGVLDPSDAYLLIDGTSTTEGTFGHADEYEQFVFATIQYVKTVRYYAYSSGGAAACRVEYTIDGNTWIATSEVNLTTTKTQYTANINQAIMGLRVKFTNITYEVKLSNVEAWN